MSGLSEAVCEDCGGANPVWHAKPDAIWNAAAQGAHFLCPNCFIARADDGTQAWRVSPVRGTGAARSLRVRLSDLCATLMGRA